MKKFDDIMEVILYTIFIVGVIAMVGVAIYVNIKMCA